MTISLDTEVCVSTTQIATDFSNSAAAADRDEVIVLNLDNGEYFELSDVGARIWQLIQQPVRVADILQRLLEEYEVQEQECSSDLLEILADLKVHGLIDIPERT